MRKKESQGSGKKPKAGGRERRVPQPAATELQGGPGQAPLNAFFFLLLVALLVYQAASSINRIAIPEREVFRGSECFPPSGFAASEACPRYNTKFSLNSSVTIAVSLANARYAAHTPILRRSFVLSPQLHEFEAVLPVRLLAEFDKVAVEVYSHDFEIKHILRDDEVPSPDHVQEVTSGWAGNRRSPDLIEQRPDGTAQLAKSLDFVLLSRQKQWPADAHELNAVIAQKFSLNESRSFEFLNRSSMVASNTTANLTIRLEVCDEDEMRWRYRLHVYFAAQFRTQVRNLSYLEAVDAFVHYDARKIALTLVGLFVYFNIAWRRVREGKQRSRRTAAETADPGRTERKPERLSVDIFVAAPAQIILLARAAALPTRVAAERRELEPHATD